MVFISIKDGGLSTNLNIFFTSFIELFFSKRVIKSKNGHNDPALLSVLGAYLVNVKSFIELWTAMIKSLLFS